MLVGSVDGGTEPVALGAGAVTGADAVGGAAGVAAGGRTVGSDCVEVRPGGVVVVGLAGEGGGTVLAGTVAATNVALAVSLGLRRRETLTADVGSR